MLVNDIIISTLIIFNDIVEVFDSNHVYLQSNAIKQLITMRAKDKKRSIIIFLAAAIAFPILMIWNPGFERPYNYLFCVFIVSALIHIIDKIWKWEEADSDKQPSEYYGRSNKKYLFDPFNLASGHNGLHIRKDDSDYKTHSYKAIIIVFSCFLIIGLTIVLLFHFKII